MATSSTFKSASPSLPATSTITRKTCRGRVQPDIAGGGYFYDLAPHQIDLLQEIFGCVLEASGYKSNRGGLYPAEDTLSACFQFDSGLVGSGSWCFVAHESAREDRIEIIGDKGMICFSVFTYDPLRCIRKEDVKNHRRKPHLRPATAYTGSGRPPAGQVRLQL